MRWTDTKGIDGTALRPDLQKKLEDPRSLLVLCSGFAVAPGVEAQIIIEHAVESGLRTAIDNRTLFLALPHDGDARRMIDPITLKKFKTDEEGYEEKERQVQDSGICKKYTLEVPILFLNANSAEDCRTVPCQIRDAVRLMRKHYTDQIDQIGQTVQKIILDHDRVQTEDAQREVNRQLHLFLRLNQALTERSGLAYIYLIGEVEEGHHSSVKASLRRRGEWDNFNVYLYLATGAAREAQSRSSQFFNRLDGVISQLLADENLAPCLPT